ncbi:hypothetical protein M3Y99_00415700 [Aphelenchoides fujianensis]|nr:hypothetical protein M3Y99_00415700 [Aphelenchoides fujianensis]
MGCIVSRCFDPSPPDIAVKDFFHIGGVLLDVPSEDAQNFEEQRVQHCPPGVLYVFNSRLFYRARHCTFSRGTEMLQWEIGEITEVSSFNKFTSRKDGRTFAKTVVDVTIAPNSNPSEVIHVGFVTKEADKIAQRLQEVCQKHRQKPRIFQFSSVDQEGIEIDVP